MRVGDRVRVYSERCSFFGQSGSVAGLSPLMVRLDGEEKPLAFGPREVIADESTRAIGGAE